MKQHSATCTKQLEKRKKESLSRFLKEQRSHYLDGKMTLEKLCEAVLHSAVCGNLSFRQACNPEQINIYKIAWPVLQMPTWRSIKNCLDRRANEAIEDLKQRFRDNESKISLSADCWSSRNNNAFMGMSQECAFLAYSHPLPMTSG